MYYKGFAYFHDILYRSPNTEQRGKLKADMSQVINDEKAIRSQDKAKLNYNDF